MKVAGILSAFAQLFIAVAIGAVAFALTTYKPVVEQYLSYMGQHDCAQDFRLTYLDEKTNTTVNRPIDDLYRQCLADKDLK